MADSAAGSKTDTAFGTGGSSKILSRYLVVRIKPYIVTALHADAPSPTEYAGLPVMQLIDIVCQYLQFERTSCATATECDRLHPTRPDPTVTALSLSVPSVCVFSIQLNKERYSSVMNHQNQSPIPCVMKLERCVLQRIQIKPALF